MSGQRYCDLNWLECIPVCPTGFYADPIVKECVLTCTSLSYYADPATGFCVNLCPINTFGDWIARSCVS